MAGDGFGVMETIVGGAAGILSAALMALGLKGRIDDLQVSKVDKSAYEEHKEGNDHAFQVLEEGQRSINMKLDRILERMSRRKTDADDHE